MRKLLVSVAMVVLGAGLAHAQGVAPPPPPAPDNAVFGMEQGSQPPQKRQPMPPMAPRAPMPAPDLGKWWKNSEVVQELQLSDAQVAQLEQAFLDHRLRLIDLRAAVEREEIRLQPLIEADQLDLAKVSAQLDVVLAARGKLEKENTMMMLSLRKVLSVDQWRNLQTLHYRHGKSKAEEYRRFGEMPPPGAGPKRRPAPPEQPETN